MSQAPSMPVFTDALIGDTTHLTMSEFGAYCMILFVTWRNNGVALPDDDKRMARICRMTQDKWRKIRPTLVEFFDLSEGTWRQKRLEREWDFVMKFRTQQSEKGKLGGRPKSLENKETDKANGLSRLKPDESPHTHIKEEEVEKGKSSEAKASGAIAPVQGGLSLATVDGERTPEKDYFDLAVSLDASKQFRDAAGQILNLLDGDVGAAITVLMTCQGKNSPFKWLRGCIVQHKTRAAAKFGGEDPRKANPRFTGKWGKVWLQDGVIAGAAT